MSKKEISVWLGNEKRSLSELKKKRKSEKKVVKNKDE